MSQRSLTSQEQVLALECLGYSPREAEFLRLVALHGGYFLRRQYCQFIGKLTGGTAALLIEKILERSHGSGALFANNTQVYHLSSRSLYGALGQEDNRNRRERQPFTVKTKLMNLDYVLAHPGVRFLATEQQKVDYFCGQLGVEQGALPTKRYTGRESFTERFFVEKYPIAVEESTDSSPPVVSFCFVDAGLVGTDGFATFLIKYRDLLERLPQFEVVYVAETPRPFTGAQKRFQGLLGRGQGAARCEMAQLIPDLQTHFEARRLADRKDWGSFDRSKLNQLREDLRRFSDSAFNHLYEQWLQRGDAALREAGAFTSEKKTLPGGHFRTFQLTHSYAFFGSLLFA